MQRLLVILPLLLATGFSQELLTNGDFEQELTVGWTYADSGGGTHFALRDTAYDPDPDFEACVGDSEYEGSGWTRLGQTVDVPGPFLLLSFSASFAIGGGNTACWPVASVVVSYKNESGLVLGETRFYHHNVYCNWVPGPTLSLVEITNPDWNQYTLDIAEELNQHLPDVNPADVFKVEVALWDTITGG
jgi:hypothetical protein